ncbi:MULTISPECIES: hypothetical protein [Salimicrobium]|nr:MULTISPECIES: hypothetical protein [Salimicrobium]MBM7696003.1 hypothetical protein [Salimicrobium jeotgali]
MSRKLSVFVVTMLLVLGSATAVTAKETTYEISAKPVIQADFPDQH